MDAPAPPTLHTSVAQPLTNPYPSPPAPTAVPLLPAAFLTSDQVLSAPPPVSMPAPAMAYTIPPPTAPPPINTTFHESGTPIHAAQFASPTHFFPEADTEQERRLKRMEETIRALQANDVRPDARYGDCSLFPGIRLPLKFKVPEFKTYEGTTDPRHHLRHYRGKMLQYWEYEEFAIHSFQDSLLTDAGKKLDMGIKLGKIEGTTGKEEQSSKNAATAPSPTGNKKGRDASVNAVNLGHQMPMPYQQQYPALPINYSAPPAYPPTRAPQPHGTRQSRAKSDAWVHTSPRTTIGSFFLYFSREGPDKERNRLNRQTNMPIGFESTPFRRTTDAGTTSTIGDDGCTRRPTQITKTGASPSNIHAEATLVTHTPGTILFSF
ncbi:hypothetical protein CRG98_029623 [Punica granatum]|uniref:Uncharacterized protein n=1 Tax=Punica granatum TaxID=22663 RepID=A0A2I0J159_PUNGR|nr:hypothetical protein CRG98_029623 [Punica granatum]